MRQEITGDADMGCSPGAGFGAPYTDLMGKSGKNLRGSLYGSASGGQELRPCTRAADSRWVAQKRLSRPDVWPKNLGTFLARERYKPAGSPHPRRTDMDDDASLVAAVLAGNVPAF